MRGKEGSVADLLENGNAETRDNPVSFNSEIEPDGTGLKGDPGRVAANRNVG